jgi:hypothetical protein
MAPPLPAAQPPANGPVLRDIHLPPDPSWWPPAPGWWLLAVLVLTSIAFGAWWWRRHARTARRRQGVLDELTRLRAVHRAEGDDARLLADLHQLLRRVASLREPQAARQELVAWHATLARVPVNAATLQRLQQLDAALYRPDPDLDIPQLLDAVETWLRAASARRWKPVEASHA